MRNRRVLSARDRDEIMEAMKALMARYRVGTGTLRRIAEVAAQEQR